MHQPAEDFNGNYLAPSSSLLGVMWTLKFHPELLEHYNIASSPIEFLQIYSTAMRVDRGLVDVLANYFHVFLKGGCGS